MMSRFPTGVSVVACTGADGSPRGLTCSSVSSVALSPPTLLVGLRTASPVLAALVEVGRFAVTLLHADGRWAAELFASGAADRFDRVAWVAGAAGPHLSLDGHTAADCAVLATQRVGDHTVVFGQVTAITSYQDRPPLLYGLRSYRAWS
ncbi:hypothetical protein BJP25_24250 [Actinokineospora bangkokensis]|uniref:Flavin reductase like domain-containing protein n=2 Tax=Actinokineospora bangkokensis TaxID=1193682 RepID=A0A1Q9LJ15_9PSEU|nr:hypothetical protein BJP25_24250 [Actinokineospora bangkokensis]